MPRKTREVETRLVGNDIVEKKCTDCGEFRPLDDYYRQIVGFLGTYPWCKKCHSIRSKRYRDKYKEEYGESRNAKNWRENKEEESRRYRAWHFKTKYNLTEEEVSKLQENGCMCCGSFENLAMDHNHTTNEVRGVLCSKCNQALGLLEEDIHRILSLAQYLDDRTPREEMPKIGIKKAE